MLDSPSGSPFNVGVMNNMKIFTLLLCSYFLISCSDGIELSYFDDPFSGERLPARTTQLDEWVITSVGDEIIILSKGNKNIVGIMNSTDKREVMVFSPSNPLQGAATLIDDGGDLIYESITYGDGKNSITDIALDGTLDGVLDFDKKELMVNYQGSLYPFVEEKGNRHIVVNNEQIPMVYKYGTFVSKQ